MKKFHKIADFIFLYLNIIVVFLLPLNGNLLSIYDPSLKYNLLPIPFILFVLFSLFTSGFSLKKAFSNWFFIGLIAFFLFYVFSAFIFSESELALKAIESKLSFLTIPLVIFSNPEFYQKNKKLLFLVLLVAVVTSLLLLDYKAYFYFKESQTMALYVTYTILMHPTYFGTFVLVCLIVVLDYFFKEKLNTFKATLMVLFIWFLFLHFLLILSKAVLLIGLLVLLFYVFYRIKTELKKVTLLMGIVLIPFTALLFQNEIRTLLISGVRYRFTDITSGSSDYGSTSFRFMVLKNTPDIIGGNWLSGVGAGNEGEYLQKYYLDKDWEYALHGHFNTHNQLIQTWLSVGVFGFVLLLCLLVVPLFLKTPLFQKIILLSFLLLFCTEAMLERQFGIVFFTLIFSVLMVNVPSKKTAKQ